MKRHFEIFFACVMIVLLFIGTAQAQEPSNSRIIELLWPEGAPGAKGNAERDKPTLTICLPDKEKAIGTGIVICPGGGYGFVSMDREGLQIANWLNSIGISAFVLDYRQNGRGYQYPAPMQDAQRAMRIVRSRAKEFSIDPERIGIMGFSAGGHLASSIGTHFQKNFYEPKDDLDKANCRPDFMILLYPVITMDDSFTHRGSKRSLLGQNPDPNLVESFSNEKQVTSQTPPTFLVHSNEDRTVPVENSIYFYLALRKARVPAEMHIYLKGSHGSAIETRFGPISTWPDRCATWMNLLGLMDKKSSG